MDELQNMDHDELLSLVIDLKGDELMSDALALNNFIFEVLEDRYADLSREELIALIAPR